MQSEQDCPPAETVDPLTEESMINLNYIILCAFQYLHAKIVLCSYLVKRCPSKDVDDDCEKQRHLEICYLFLQSFRAYAIRSCEGLKYCGNYSGLNLV